MIILARGIKPMANKKVTPFMVGLLACVTLTGCSESGTQLLFENEPDTKDAYYSDVALSATEYSIFIEGIKTKINSYGMTLVSNVAQYKSAADKESVSGNIAATKENLEKLYDELKHKRPAQGYESTRENMMSAVNNILAQANYVAECITDGIEYDADNVSTTIKSQISALIN